MSAEAGAAVPSPETDPGPALVALWRTVAARMADLPVYNPRLEVQATEFRRHGAWRVGVVTTPWFMNAVALPDRPETLPGPARPVEVPLPDGTMDAFVAELDGFGRFATASLFSPMDDFSDPARTRAVAEAALDELLAPPQPPVTAAPVDRRALLFGRRAEPRP